MPPSAYEIYARSHTQAHIAEAAGVCERTVRNWASKGVPPHIERLFDALLSKPDDSAAFTFIDLFAGIGGTRLGFEKAGGRCLFTSEWDKKAVATYTENFRQVPEHSFAGDITAVASDDIPDHDVLVAGFPCQPFSIAGVSKKRSLGRPTGFADETQGTLFFDVARIINAKQPRAFLLENVRNLQSHDRGRTFDTIMRTLRDQLGYSTTFAVLSAQPWVPQKRHRIFIVGFRDIQAPEDFFERIPVPHPAPTLSTILHPQDGSQEAEEPYTSGPLARVAEKYTLSDKLWAYLQNYAEKHRRAGNGFGFGLVGPEDVARTLSARYYKDGSEILVAQQQKNPRRLTPRECARLMGFPDSFQIPVADTPAYHQFGNSVVVPLIEALATSLREELALTRPSQTR